MRVVDARDFFQEMSDPRRHTLGAVMFIVSWGPPAPEGSSVNEFTFVSCWGTPVCEPSSTRD